MAVADSAKIIDRRIMTMAASDIIGYGSIGGSGDRWWCGWWQWQALWRSAVAVG
jgi:hypothetical protein